MPSNENVPCQTPTPGRPLPPALGRADATGSDQPCHLRQPPPLTHTDAYSGSLADSSGTLGRRPRLRHRRSGEQQLPQPAATAPAVDPTLLWLVKCCGEEHGRRKMRWRTGGEAVVRLQRSGGRGRTRSSRGEGEGALQEELE